MRLGGGSITFSFFSERHIAAIPLDETILSMHWGGGSIVFPFLPEQHIEGILLDEQKLCIQCHASARWYHNSVHF